MLHMFSSDICMHSMHLLLHQFVTLAIGPPSSTVRSSNNKSKIAGAVIGGTFGAGCLIGVLICITCKIRNKQQQQTVAEGDLFTQRTADAQQAREGMCSF